MLTRVAASHIRVGTFQYFAARGDTEGVRRLADHVIARHYPQAADSDQPYLALLEGVIARQADLVARWMLVGFIHGVMNTDNSSISGETIDYGPCAFMDHYDPATVFSSIDEQGRYAYANQPQNRALEPDAAGGVPAAAVVRRQGQRRSRRRKPSLGGFAEKFSAAYQAGLRSKIGLFTARDGDEALVQDLLDAMARNQADFTLTFRRLSDAALDPAEDAEVRQLFADPAAYRRMGDTLAATDLRGAARRPPIGRPRCGRSIPPSFRETTGWKP